MPQFGWKKTLIYSLLPALLLFGVLEGAARIVEIWVPPLSTDYDLGFGAGSKLFIPSKEKPGLMVRNPEKTACPPQEFVLPKPNDLFRVFLLGGSSVNHIWRDCVPLGERLSQQFQNAPRFEVINVGLPAYGSQRLAMIMRELVKYSPNLIIFHEANNEFEELDQVRLVNLKTIPLQRVLYRSALCRFLRDRYALRQVARMQRLLDKDQVDFWPAQNYRFSSQEVTERMAAFSENLLDMANTCESAQVPLVLDTVPSDLRHPDLPSQDDEKRVDAIYNEQGFVLGATVARELLSASYRHQSSDVENGIVRLLAFQRGLPLADVEAAVIMAEPHNVPGETLFEDRCHLNAQGNAIFIRVLEETIARMAKESASRKQP